MYHPASRLPDINLPGRFQDAMLRRTSRKSWKSAEKACSSHLQIACSGLQLDKQLRPPAGLRVVNMAFWAICLISRFRSMCTACGRWDVT